MMSSGQPAWARRCALRALLCGAALGGSFLVSAPAQAQQVAEGISGKVTEPPSLPSRDELNRDPAATGLLLFDLLEQAAAAEKSGDTRGALHAYEAIARAVPERATAFSKLCELHRALGEREAALAACYRATGLPGSKVADHLRYVELLLGKPPGEPFDSRELDELRASFGHLRKEGVTGPDLEVLECQFAVVLEELDPLQRCVERLRATLPSESPFRLTYEMSLALFQDDLERARAILREARRADMSVESIQLMEAEIARRAAAGPGGALASARESSFAGVLGGGLAVAALAALAAAGWFAHRRRPKAA
jgi:tetratricopeptide (TPR) repeat protein